MSARLEAEAPFSQAGLPTFAQPDPQNPKPRRRLRDSDTDVALGLDVLLLKTKAISLRREPENLATDEADAYSRLHSHNFEECLDGAVFFRKYVCGEGSEQRVQSVLAWHILDKIIWFMQVLSGVTQPNIPDSLLFESLWIITNIAAGPTVHTTAIVDAGFLPYLCQSLSHNDGRIRTQAAWAIGNIVGDREGYRDIVLQAGVLEPLLKIWHGEFIDDPQRKEAFRISMWCIDNMCRYRPNWNAMAPIFVILPQVLQQDDPYLLKECCWAIARILHQSGRHIVIDSMITLDFCARLNNILARNEMITTHPILRALINLSSSKNSTHLRYLIETNTIKHLDCLLVDAQLPKSCRNNLQIFSVQILGNFASNRSFVELVCSSSRLCDWLINSFKSLRAELDLQNEICITLRNCLFHQIEAINQAFVGRGFIPSLLWFMECTPTDSKMQLVALETIQYLGKSAIKDTYNGKSALEMMEENGAFDRIFNLLVKNSSVELEQMDQDGSDGEDEDSDCEVNHTPEPTTSAFHLSNPSNDPNTRAIYGHSKHRQKIASKSKTVLFTLFNSQFMARISSAQNTSDLMRGFDGMCVATSQNTMLDELSAVFSNLNPVQTHPKQTDSAVELSPGNLEN